MVAEPDILTEIYNTIDPFRPLEAGDPKYVDCRAVRGDADILVDLGREIVRSRESTCQLYAGHRGAGKSTELLQLKADLEKKGCFVVYFAAVGENGDIDPEDAEYTDILLACTRHLLEGLKMADAKPLLSWLKGRLTAMKDLGLTEISLDGLSVDVGIREFARLSTTLRAVPSERRKIRDLVNPHTVTLLQALNEFINDAKKKLPPGKTKLVTIADNLDRIVPIRQDDGRSNHDEIFVDRSEQLRSLDCDLIYTIPISMVYSNRANDLKDLYGNHQILPMIMVRCPDGSLNEPGLDAMRAVLAKRILDNPLVQKTMPDATLEADIFANADLLQRLCLSSGGHVRELLLLVKEAINYTDVLPIQTRAVQRAITTIRDTYRRTVESDQWAILARVAKTQRIENDDIYRALLFSRCVLEYRYFDEEGEMHCWYDAHPLIKDIAEFKTAVDRLEQATGGGA
ncbi:MAG: ATP-binding protein [Leptolyngbya sp. DLM2.Bin15]|nr:MAG: ATP-binding protein [Leptolyngbya sp. DLM2.Bin15]